MKYAKRSNGSHLHRTSFLKDLLFEMISIIKNCENPRLREHVLLFDEDEFISPIPVGKEKVKDKLERTRKDKYALNTFKSEVFFTLSTCAPDSAQKHLIYDMN